jgi:hypothetical protein
MGEHLSVCLVVLPLKMENHLIAHVILLIVLLVLVVYILYRAFDAFSLFMAFVLTSSVITINPNLIERINSQNAIQYYAVILIVSVLFSIECCKSDANLVLLLIITAGVTLISLYVGQKPVLYLSVFLNTYLISRVGKAVWDTR